MQGIVAQEESKGHGDSSTVPQGDYGVGVVSGGGAAGTSGVPVTSAAGGSAGADRAAASAAVLGMPASIHF
jgi:hypothetical protein